MKIRNFNDTLGGGPIASRKAFLERLFFLLIP